MRGELLDPRLMSKGKVLFLAILFGGLAFLLWEWFGWALLAFSLYYACIFAYKAHRDAKHARGSQVRPTPVMRSAPARTSQGSDGLYLPDGRD